MDAKQKKLKDIIFSIPMDKWELYQKEPCPAYSCEHNGIKITLQTSHGSNSPWFSINGVTFYFECIGELKYKIEKFIESKIINESLKKQ